MPWYITLLHYLAYYLLAGSVVAYPIIRSLTKMTCCGKLPEYGTEYLDGKFRIVNYKKFALLFSVLVVIWLPGLIIGLFCAIL